MAMPFDAAPDGARRSHRRTASARASAHGPPSAPTSRARWPRRHWRTSSATGPRVLSTRRSAGQAAAADGRMGARSATARHDRQRGRAPMTARIPGAKRGRPAKPKLPQRRSASVGRPKRRCAYSPTDTCSPITRRWWPWAAADAGRRCVCRRCTRSITVAVDDFTPDLSRVSVHGQAADSNLRPW